MEKSEILNHMKSIVEKQLGYKDFADYSQKFELINAYVKYSTSCNNIANFSLFFGMNRIIGIDLHSNGIVNFYDKKGNRIYSVFDFVILERLLKSIENTFVFQNSMFN